VLQFSFIAVERDGHEHVYHVLEALLLMPR